MRINNERCRQLELAMGSPIGWGLGEKGAEVWAWQWLTMIATKLWAVKVVRNKIVVNLLT